MQIKIRLETPTDYRTVEELPRDAFWGCMDQLTEMGVRNPVCSLLRSKDGISVYRVESEGKRLILKVYDKPEDAREIDNYLILKELNVPALPLLGYTKNAILLPEVTDCMGAEPAVATDTENQPLHNTQKHEPARNTDNKSCYINKSISTESHLTDSSTNTGSGHTDINTSTESGLTDRNVSTESGFTNKKAGTKYCVNIDTIAGYRLGMESDLSNPAVARAIAKWYRILHTKGREYLYLLQKENAAHSTATLYDESDVITPDNMRFVEEKTGTGENPLWKTVFDNFTAIRTQIDALPRTLVYNDFYYTNLIVANDCCSAFMFDYNLLGKGMAYGDIRNVTSSLSPEAAEAFTAEYDVSGLEKEKKTDAFLSPLVTLYFACECKEFPSWAEDSLAELKNGSLLCHLNAWL